MEWGMGMGLGEGEGEGEGVGVGRTEKTDAGGRISNTIEKAASIISHYRPSVAGAATRRYSAGNISEKPSVALKRLVLETETKSSSQISTAGFTGKSRLCKGEMMDEKKPASECSLCGDVGFVQHLLLCKRCGYRLQHTYCSKLYPDLDMESWACEWCLFEEENNGTAKTKLGKRKMESRIKAFEFLLQIAQTSPTTSTSSSDRQRHRDSGDASKASGIASRKENGLQCGSVKVGKAEPRHAQTARYIMEENKLKLGHLCENCKEDNRMKSEEQVPKKQRCSHSHHPSYKSNKALDNWRNLAKSKLHCSNTSKAIGRRYKLLADVHC